MLRTMVPQIDRVCVTTVKDGKLVELMGPLLESRRQGNDDDPRGGQGGRCEEGDLRADKKEAEEARR